MTLTQWQSDAEVSCFERAGIGSPAIISARFSMKSHKGDVTALLERLSEGDRAAEEELMPRVYIELHRLATSRLRSERPGHTLQATALVHEVYLRLCDANDIKWNDRAHFFRVAARQMRRILVDYARRHGALKRNNGVIAIPLDDALAISTDQSVLAIELDDALEKLAEISPRQAQVVEMKFFADLSEADIALALGVNVRTIRRDWFMAQAWLHKLLKP